MRRVVVTGMGMVTPLGSGVETTWSRLLAGESGAVRITDSRSPTCPARSPAAFRAATARTAPSIPTSRWSRRSSARSTTSSSSRWRRPTRRIADSGWEPETEDDRYATGVLIGSGIGGIGGIVEAGITLHERGPRRISPFFIPGPADQPRLRLRLDQARPEGAEPRGRHRLLDRRACDRRRVAADRARRRRRDGGRRHRIAGRAASRSPASPPAARSRRISTTGPRRPRAPTTRTATASSWARAPAPSCSRSSSTPRRAARRSMAR